MDKILKFKDQSIIKEENFNPESNTYSVLFNNTIKYLDSTIIDFIPSGIINKGKTGLGATTFELNSKRNSIIVEPLRITASSKAGEDHLYIGSPTIKHPKTVTDEEILDYLTNDDVEFKKIICVSDSLTRIEKVLDKDYFSTFFLMIDESDSLQMDSSFRDSMERVYLIYKNHPKDSRCMISATPIHFNDPELRGDMRFDFIFEEKEYRNIEILESSNHKGTVVDLILKLYVQNVEEKIVFAFNNVKVLLEIAKYLVEKGVKKEEISLLCGVNNKENTTGFRRDLVEEKLPSRIVLKTSAYFTGFDLLEKYHLIMAVVTGDFLNILSEKRITQIAGRARMGLLSETIILNYNESQKKKKESHNLRELEKMAALQLQVFHCIESNFRTNKLLKERIKEGYQALLNKTKIEGFSLITLNDGTPKFSYLSIDAILDTVKAKNEIYSSKRGLYDALKKTGHHVTVKIHNSKTKVGKGEDENSAKRKENVMEILSGNLMELSIKEHYYDHEDVLVRNVARAYIDYRKFFKPDEFTKSILKVWHNSKSMNRFVEAVKFVILSEDSKEKREFKLHFPIDATLRKDEIIDKMESIYESLVKGGILAKDRTQEQKEKFLIREFNLKVSTKRQSNNLMKGKEEKFTVLGYNTIGLEPQSYKPEFRTTIGGSKKRM
jgi:hypothetical protein